MMPSEDRNQAAQLQVKLAETPAELEQAFRLRYQVFVEEAGNDRLINDQKLERDTFDPYCDHLIVIDKRIGEVVGTYRLLPGDRALMHDGFYSETEFDLSSLNNKKTNTLELGRSCIAPDYRNGNVLMQLWKGIGQYIQNKEYSIIIGCASIPVRDLQQINEIYSMLKAHTMLKEDYGITPLPTNQLKGLQASPVEGSEKEMLRRLPPLMRGYHSLGAKIAGEPAYDPLFHTLDFLIILETDNANRKLRRMLE